MDSKPSCLLRGTTLAVCSLRPSLRAISIHVPLAGHDKALAPLIPDTRNFNPHAPCGARPGNGLYFYEQLHFNPHAPCGARLCKMAGKEATTYFNPHAPCGARHNTKSVYVLRSSFQSTCPLRGTTRSNAKKIPVKKYFNPHAPCGARRHRRLMRG